MEKDEIKTSGQKQIGTNTFLKRVIEYIQRNIGTFTFLTTTTIAIGGVILRVIAYLIEYGKITYFNVSSSLIDVSGDNILYDLFVKGVFALLFVLLNLILFILWRGKSKTWVKVGWSLLFVLFPDIILGFCLVIDNIHGIKYSMLEIGISFFIAFILGCVLFFWGIYNGICEYRFKIKQKEDLEEELKKDETKNLEKEIKNEIRLKVFKMSFLIFASLLVIESLLFIAIGYDIAYSQNHFKIINNSDNTNYAVIYENPSRYVITECEIEGGYISFPKRDIQQEIDRDNVEYQWQRLTQKR